MTEHDNKTTSSHNGKETPQTQPKVFSTALESQLVLLLTLANLLLLTSITALILKLGWMGLLAIIAVF